MNCYLPKDMMQIEIRGVRCACFANYSSTHIAYILSPFPSLEDWADKAAKRYNVSIVVISGFDWQDAMSPWPAKAVPKGTGDFRGDAPHFLNLLKTDILPEIETTLRKNFAPSASDSKPIQFERSLIGISMSGLFALWQWMISDSFRNIASLSGSFWYEGFVDWLIKQPISHKEGKAFFLLGNRESLSSVPEFRKVGACTETIVDRIKQICPDTKYEIVAGDHYANPLPRLDAAFTFLFS